MPEKIGAGDEVCDGYLEQARAGRILGRKRKPIKASTLDSDESRIESHIKPLLGARAVRGLTLRDIEAMQADIIEGKSAKGRKGRGGRTTGGAGAAGRTVGTLRSIFGHALRLELIEKNPAAGVRQVAGNQKKRRLNEEELQLFGRTMRVCGRGRAPDWLGRDPASAAYRLPPDGGTGPRARVG